MRRRKKSHTKTPKILYIRKGCSTWEGTYWIVESDAKKLLEGAQSGDEMFAATLTSLGIVKVTVETT